VTPEQRDRRCSAYYHTILRIQGLTPRERLAKVEALYLNLGGLRPSAEEDSARGIVGFVTLPGYLVCLRCFHWPLGGHVRWGSTEVLRDSNPNAFEHCEVCDKVLNEVEV